MLNRSLLFAGALVVAAVVAAPAHAQTAADQCRLYAANLWPNTLDAFENEMRGRTYASCMARPAPPQPAPSAAVQKCVDDMVPDGHVSGAYIRDAYAACQARQGRPQ